MLAVSYPSELVVEIHQNAMLPKTGMAALVLTINCDEAEYLTLFTEQYTELGL